MNLLLCTFGLESYIHSENLQIITADDPNYNNNCIKVQGTSDLYYKENVNKTMIKNDNKAKCFISLSLDDETKRKINFNTFTAYEIWKLLKGTFQKGNEERKENLKTELGKLRYNLDKDFEILLSGMENLFYQLKELGAEPSDEQKFNYLFKALPRNLTQNANIMVFLDNWEECKKHLIKVIPRYKFLTKDKTNLKAFNTTTIGVKRNYKSIGNNSNTKGRNERTIKCYKCNGLGHIPT